MISAQPSSQAVLESRISTPGYTSNNFKIILKLLPISDNKKKKQRHFFLCLAFQSWRSLCAIGITDTELRNAFPALQVTYSVILANSLFISASVFP